VIVVANSVKAEEVWSDRSTVRHPRRRCYRPWRRQRLAGGNRRGEAQPGTPGAAHTNAEL
jgi:hypothetical protein